jgi:hypothetical protein
MLTTNHPELSNGDVMSERRGLSDRIILVLGLAVLLNYVDRS